MLKRPIEDMCHQRTKVGLREPLKEVRASGLVEAIAIKLPQRRHWHGLRIWLRYSGDLDLVPNTHYQFSPLLIPLTVKVAHY